MRCTLRASAGALTVATVLGIVAGASAFADGGLASDPVPLQVADAPERPRPLLELGNPFLGQGRVDRGIRLPTGAVWQPSLLVFGTLRSALGSFDARRDGETATSSAWANRLDLFANLTLTGTERLLIGFRPLDRDGRFSGFDFDAGDDDWTSEWNADLTTLFFEGDFGELFPGLDGAERHSLDLGFSVGRQPLFFQEGLLIDDSIDAFGVTRNTLRPDGMSNARITALYGWGGIHRGDGTEDEGASLFAVLTELDTERSTVTFDAALVMSGRDAGDSFHLGLGAVQRIGRLNTAFRVLGSVPFRTEASGAQRGALLFGEASWSTSRQDIVYGSAFVMFDAYTPAARDPMAGPALSRTGILFSAPGIGDFGAALDGATDDTAGGAIGYQFFMRDGRSQVVVEAGLQHDDDRTSGAVGARYQRALGRRLLLRVDGFTVWGESDSTRLGGRVELQVKF